ncbi:MAG: AMP-binding protein [Rhodobiaceae bacterium]|nr:AMP-binding protein [Rhodobiaceae bacterium]MCC0056192.1 AMP-binding protein [Rhodobiaceae bacterium]
MLKQFDSFAETYANFAWYIPEHFNIGHDICDKWADRFPERTAILDVKAIHDVREISFAELKARSNRLANALRRRGVACAAGGIGDRVGVLLPQRVETAAAHIAIAKLGCISIPLFTLFGVEALLHRLKDSGAKGVITDRTGVGKILPLLAQLPELKVIMSVDGAEGPAEDFDVACMAEDDRFEPVATRAEDPAILIYTSGTTGNPKGALHAHRVLLGHLPGVEISHDFFPQPGDRIWTPADWAWIGGLLDVLMPALHHGVTVVAQRFQKFSAADAFELMTSLQVRNAFLPPTALKMMKIESEKLGLTAPMRSVASGGEALGAELLDWGRKAFGVSINEFYGQTECNMIVSSCAALEAPVPGVMGRPVPGHVVDVIDPQTGEPRPDGAEGTIAVLSPDPVMFLEYWNNRDATDAKFVSGPAGSWLVTGDRGQRDGEGRIRFVGRDDDVINSAGYRIGPAEIESCLLGHPAVRNAGVVGKPDSLRGEVVTAFVVPGDQYEPSRELADDIAAFVKSRLAAHEYPRDVRFIAELPVTTTGKIIRNRLREILRDEAAGT